MTQDPTAGAGRAPEEEPPATPATEAPDATDAATDPAAGPAPAAGPETEQAAAPTPGGEETAAQADAEVEADMADAELKVAALTEDLQRLHAEYVNYKKRVDRDRELVLQNSMFSVLSALLPVLDDVDRARAHGELEGGF